MYATWWTHPTTYIRALAGRPGWRWSLWTTDLGAVFPLPEDTRAQAAVVAERCGWELDPINPVDGCQRGTVGRP